MRALLQGRRNASLGVTLGLVGMICLLAVSTGLAIYGMTNLHDLRSTIVGRCEKRLALDTSTRNSIKAQAAFYASLEAIAADAPPVTDPRYAALYARQKAAIHLARTQAEAAVRAGVLGSCNAYKH